MNPYEIYIAYISWGDGGKRRPVVILSRQGEKVDVFRVTSQFQNKSAVIQSNYLPIVDWRQAGLDKPSYIDMSAIINLPVSTICAPLVGKLSERDKQAFIEVLEIYE